MLPSLAEAEKLVSERKEFQSERGSHWRTATAFRSLLTLTSGHHLSTTALLRTTADKLSEGYSVHSLQFQPVLKELLFDLPQVPKSIADCLIRAVINQGPVRKTDLVNPGCPSEDRMTWQEACNHVTLLPINSDGNCELFRPTMSLLQLLNARRLSEQPAVDDLLRCVINVGEQADDKKKEFVGPWYMADLLSNLLCAKIKTENATHMSDVLRDARFFPAAQPDEQTPDQTGGIKLLLDTTLREPWLKSYYTQHPEDSREDATFHCRTRRGNNDHKLWLKLHTTKPWEENKLTVQPLKVINQRKLDITQLFVSRDKLQLSLPDASKLPHNVAVVDADNFASFVAPFGALFGTHAHAPVCLSHAVLQSSAIEQ